jgi:hypothetical protein
MLFRFFHINPSFDNQPNILEESYLPIDTSNGDELPMLGWSGSFTEIAYEAAKINTLNLEKNYDINLENFRGKICIAGEEHNVDELNEVLAHQDKPTYKV